ncbi:MAG TPA: NAD(P)-dependent oxidoreductase, partial [Bacteriovoracaceae bacterium]|nr:NAD(P)-dependent oxidoreductase [Bacteriovoracaceae bacterium]
FLKNHPEACYLSDVATPEPYPPSGELLKLSNVYLTPHISARFETIWNKLEAECLEVIKDKNV